MHYRCERVLGLAACLAAGLGLPGCVRDRPATTTRPAVTETIDPKSADPNYWYAKPAVVSVPAANYDAVLYQCQQTLKARRFDIDRIDYRSGLIETRPMISKQFWEFWRGDVVTYYDLEKSSLATYRRTVRWQITKTESGQYQAQPWVVVEHFTAPPVRVTSVVGYGGVLSNVEGITTVRPDTVQAIGEAYWYAVGRDNALEKQFAADLRELLNRR